MEWAKKIWRSAALYPHQNRKQLSFRRNNNSSVSRPARQQRRRHLAQSISRQSAQIVDGFFSPATCISNPCVYITHPVILFIASVSMFSVIIYDMFIKYWGMVM